MNRNHRTVWNESTQSWTAVSELAKGRTKGNGKAKKNVVAAMMLLTLHSQLMPVVHAYTPNVSGTTVNNETLDAARSRTSSPAASPTARQSIPAVRSPFLTAASPTARSSTPTAHRESAPVVSPIAPP